MKLYFPWRTDNTSMRPNVLLMCKMFFLLLLINGFLSYISDPFIPFISVMDLLNEYPNVFKYSIRFLFLVAGILLLFNYKVRLMASIIGISIIVTILSSKPIFRNHLFICGCAFILAGLSDKNKDPWLLYIQLSIIYLGAVTNKIFQIDWWSGQFMHNWLFIARENATYSFLSDLFPQGYLSKMISWSSIFAEIIIGILLLFKKKHVLAVWLIIIFHTILFSITAFRFGHFFEDILIFLLVFLKWPKDQIEVSYQYGKLRILRNFCSIINWNKQVVWTPVKLNKNEWLSVNISGRVTTNEVGLRSVLLYSPGLYVFLLFVDSVIRILFLHPIEHIIFIILFWGGILFFIPIKWPFDFLKAN